MSPWVTYLIADGLGLSGIVAILTNGIFLNIYAVPNLSKGSEKVLKIAYETLAYSTETLVFIFLGIGVFNFKHPTDKIGAVSVFVLILNLNFARFCNIMVTTWVVNKTRTETFINNKTKFVMWVAGLRGAMAYALAIESVYDYGEAGKQMLFLTIIYALITILIIGSVLNPILIYCGVTGSPTSPINDVAQGLQEEEKKEDVP